MIEFVIGALSLAMVIGFFVMVGRLGRIQRELRTQTAIMEKMAGLPVGLTSRV